MASTLLFKKEFTIPRVLQKVFCQILFSFILWIFFVLSLFHVFLPRVFPDFFCCFMHFSPSDSESLFPACFFSIQVHGFHCLSLHFISSLTGSATFVEVLRFPLIQSWELHLSFLPSLPEQTFASPKISVLSFAKRTTVVFIQPLTWPTCMGPVQLSTLWEVCFIPQ